MIELLRALAVLCEPPSPQQARIAQTLELAWDPSAAAHTELFIFELPPYASVYLGGEGKLGGDAAARIAGFWRALGHTPPAEPDHLAALLGLYAGLAEHERDEPDGPRRLLWRHARGALLHEHVRSWIDPYLDRLDELAPEHHRAWSALLRATLEREAAELEAPARLAAALRDAPALEPPQRVGGTAFLDQLLAPCRTGVILVRSDLARLARELGLGLRIAERRYVLGALLAQDAGGTLGWIAAEAAARAKRHRTAFWRERATRSAGILERAAVEARAVAA